MKNNGIGKWKYRMTLCTSWKLDDQLKWPLSPTRSRYYTFLLPLPMSLTIEYWPNYSQSFPARPELSRAWTSTVTTRQSLFGCVKSVFVGCVQNPTSFLEWESKTCRSLGCVLCCVNEGKIVPQLKRTCPTRDAVPRWLVLSRTANETVWDHEIAGQVSQAWASKLPRLGAWSARAHVNVQEDCWI